MVVVGIVGTIHIIKETTKENKDKLHCGWCCWSCVTPFHVRQFYKLANLLNQINKNVHSRNINIFILKVEFIMVEIIVNYYNSLPSKRSGSFPLGDSDKSTTIEENLTKLVHKN